MSVPPIDQATLDTAVALLAMFFILYAHYRSANLALQVLASIPMALIGAVVAVVITGQTVSIAVLVGIVYGYLPLMVFPIYVSLEKLDKRLLEASADLGATPAGTFRQVTLPLSMPGLITGSLLVFILLTVWAVFLGRKIEGRPMEAW